MSTPADAVPAGAAPSRRTRSAQALAAVLVALVATALIMALRSGTSADAAPAAPTGAALVPNGGAGTIPLTQSDLRAGQLKRGEELYLTSCVSCHGVAGVGGVDIDGTPAPALISSGEASASFYLQTGRMPLAAPTPQPPQKPIAYSQEQIQDLVVYVGSLCDTRNYPCPAIPDVNDPPGDLQEGGALFLANCAPCHNSIAIGGALSRGNHAPSLQETEPEQVGEAIRVGPGQMPQFGQRELSDEQVNSIVTYVQYLRSPDHPGGAPLGYTGPVSEGFVALLIGLGSLIFIIRWITRESPAGEVPASGVPHSPATTVTATTAATRADDRAGDRDGDGDGDGDGEGDA